MCVGASWVFGGHRGTLQALRDRTRSGGHVLVGEPFWIADPPAEYLAAAGMQSAEFRTHAPNVSAGEAAGFVPL